MENRVGERERCARELGFLNCGPSPDPSGGHGTEPALEELLLKKVFFGTCIHHPPGIELPTNAIPIKNIRFGDGRTDPETGRH